MQIIPRVAIDLGSSHIRTVAQGETAPVFSTRSLLVRDVSSGQIIARGSDAADYILKPGQELVQPVKDGVMIDYAAAVSLIQHALRQTLSWWHVFRPQVVVAESLKLSSAKSQALGEAVQDAGGGKVYMTSVPALAALGAGIDPTKSVGNFIVDIGGGTTEAAVITRGSAAVADAATVGGDAIAAAVSDYVEEKHDVQVPRVVAMEIIQHVGSALRRDADSSYDFYVNKSETGDAVALSITGNEIASAISPALNRITNLVADVLKRTPTTLLSDVAASGITVTGGVGALAHIDTYISRELAIPVHIAENPAQAVISGGRKALDFISMYEQSIPQN